MNPNLEMLVISDVFNHLDKRIHEYEEYTQSLDPSDPDFALKSMMITTAFGELRQMVDVLKMSIYSRYENQVK